VSGGPRAPARLIAVGLVALTLAAFSPVARNGFLGWDDPQVITKNPLVLQGLTLPGLRWALTTTDRGNWMPLTRVVNLLDVQLFGTWAGGHHLVSLGVHAAAVGVLFLALLRLTGAPGASAFAAALFGLHPLRVESVAWAAELKDVLSGLCFALALLAHQRWAARRRPADYALVVLAGALGLAAKPMLVTLPVVLLLLDFWPLGRGRGGGTRAVLAEKLPLLALGVAAGVVAIGAQAATGAIGSLAKYPWPVRLANALTSTATYLGKFFWPLRLSPFYAFDGGPVRPGSVAVALLVVAGATALALRTLRTRPWIAVGWGWYLVMLAPVAGVVQVGSQSLADRYTYLPLIGVGVALAFEAARQLADRPAARRAVAAAALAALAACCVLTPAQAARWRDTRTLFTHALALDPDNWLAHVKLGELAREERRPDLALPHLQAAVAGAPDSFYARTLLGVTLGELGRGGEALRELQEAVRLGPAWLDARHNLAVVLANAGRLDEAEAQLRIELRLSPGAARATAMLERVQALQQRLREAGAPP
jgi:Tfp pilus assembly protein PilF